MEEDNVVLFVLDNECNLKTSSSNSFRPTDVNIPFHVFALNLCFCVIKDSALKS